MRLARLMAALAVLASAAPASAQFYFKSPDVQGAPVRGDEPDIALNLPGATPGELRAGLVWQLRAALNVSALQCRFEPTLLIDSKYNALLLDHQAELKSALATLSGYFTRKAKVKRTGGTAFDQFNTRLYSSFSTVSSQFLFCQTAADVGYRARLASRGQLYQIATDNMRALRNSLRPAGEQAFSGRNHVEMGGVRLPRLEETCWARNNGYLADRCGWITL